MIECPFDSFPLEPSFSSDGSRQFWDGPVYKCWRCELRFDYGYLKMMTSAQGKRINAKEEKNMSYNPEDLKLQDVQAGQKTKTKIVQINEGVAADFFGEKYFENMKGDRAEIETAKKAPAIEVVCDNRARISLNLPVDGLGVHPKSNIGRFRNTYGSFPKVGLEVTTKTDENGFQRIVLEL